MMRRRGEQEEHIRLKRAAFSHVILPGLKSEQGMSYGEARVLLEEFNRGHGSDLRVRDMLFCIHETGQDLVIGQPRKVIARVARLAREDCNAALRDPGRRRGEDWVVETVRRIAVKVEEVYRDKGIKS